MKKKIYSKMLIALSLFAASFMLSACSDDDNSSNPSLKIEVSDIKGTSAIIKWNLISEEVLTHNIEIRDKETGSLYFEGSTGINLSTSTIETEIEATNLAPETTYTVLVSAYTINENLDAVLVKEGNAEFTTTNDGDGDGEDEDDGGSSTLPAVEEITVVEGDQMGFRINWKAVDNATGYYIYINNESISSVPINSIPYTTSEEIVKFDTVKIEAWDELTEKVIASGFILYKEDEPENVQNLTVEPGDGQATLKWDEPQGIYANIIINLFVVGQGTTEVGRVDAGVREFTITGLENYTSTSYFVCTYNSENDYTSGGSLIEVIPNNGQSIYLPYTHWVNNNGTKTLDFYLEQVNYTNNGSVISPKYYFSTETNEGRVKNWDWNGWETDTEYLPLAYNKDTNEISLDNETYTQTEE